MGLVDGLDDADPLPDLLEELRALNAGNLAMRDERGLLIRVPWGTEKRALLRLLVDRRVRFAEPMWAELDFP